MDISQIPEKVLEKIRKLANLKDGAEAVGSLHEAENAASKMQAILMEYNLSLEDVTEAQVKKKVAIGNETFDLSDKFDKREAAWVPLLFAAVAKNNLCYAWLNGHRISIIGHSDTIQLVVFIAEQLMAKIRIAEKISWKKYHELEPDGEKRGTYRRGFFQGAAYGIDARLAKDKADMMKEENPYAVMIVSREKELEEYLYGTPEERAEREKRYQEQEAARKQRLLDMNDEERKKYLKQQERDAKRWERQQSRRKGPRGLSSSDGWADGHEAGKKMTINKGVETPSSKGNIN